MLAIASAAGDALPCLFLQANDSEAAPQLVGRAAACSSAAVAGSACDSRTVQGIHALSCRALATP